MTGEERRMCGRIMSMLLQIGKGYTLQSGQFGVFHVLDRDGKTVTMGSLDAVFARVESMLNEH